MNYPHDGGPEFWCEMASSAIAVEEAEAVIRTRRVEAAILPHTGWQRVSRPGFRPRGFQPRDARGMHRLTVAWVSGGMLGLDPAAAIGTCKPGQVGGMFFMPGPCGVVQRKVEADLGVRQRMPERTVPFAAVLHLPPAGAVGFDSARHGGTDPVGCPARESSSRRTPAREELSLAGWCFPRDTFAGKNLAGRARCEGPVEVSMAANVPIIRMGVKVPTPVLCAGGFCGERSVSSDAELPVQAGFGSVQLGPDEPCIPRLRGTFQAARIGTAARRNVISESEERGVPGNLMMLRPPRVFPRLPQPAPAIWTPALRIQPARVRSEPRLAEAPCLRAPLDFPAIHLPGREQSRQPRAGEEWKMTPLRSRVRIAFLPALRAEAGGTLALGRTLVRLPGSGPVITLHGLARGGQTGIEPPAVVPATAQPVRTIEKECQSSACAYRTRSLL